ncbi:MAG: hypothetical protein RL213_125 [Bacteroidota bacterium]
MLSTLKKILGIGPRPDYREMIRSGAVILDVRTKGEYQSGHIKGSVNIPLQQLQSQMGKLDKGKPVITCCASGMRSASAKGMLKANGFAEVHNGGSWHSLQRYK